MEDFEHKLNDDYVISDERLITICKYRQGQECCKYIVFFDKPGKFYCVKNVPKIRNTLDQYPDMKAKGDNCEGLMDEKRTDDTGIS